MENEEWRSMPFDGYGSNYEVSNLGRVRRIKILKPCFTKMGYVVQGLFDGKKTRLTRVHQAVAKAFIPNPLRKGDVNHKNGIKTDNRVSNLEWNTREENIQHSYDTGLRLPTPRREENNPNTILTREQVLKIRASPSIASAWKQYPFVCKSLIEKIRTGKAWSWLK